MQWNFTVDRPIYLQIIDQMKQDIISGKYPPGYKIDSVRDLAAAASVNPNTMQRALAELEREGLIFSQRTSGKYITEDEQLINNLRSSMAVRQISKFIEKMTMLGYPRAEILTLIKSVIGEREERELDSAK